ncbi:MAG: HelD family protein [Lachnospiraceae bacterium]
MSNKNHEKETEYLADMIQKIESKLETVNKTLSAGQKDIDSMNEYYWQNYAEMDEYGYEIYDNQQALLRQINANQEQAILKQRLKRMLDSPYFGRVDFCYDGEDETESFYIGIANFAEKAGAVPLIYDWRAPVSGLFYDFDKGKASYEAPSGTLEGEIKSKWQYKIKDQKLIYSFESDTKIDDEILKEALGSNGDVQLKNIVRTIQREQNVIIRNTKDKILVIQGSAGSGKTSIALHRIAYLLYHDREHLKSSNILVLSPNSVFSDYISHILPELGEENIKEMSFDLFAYRELKIVADDCEDRFDYLEKQMKFPDREAARRMKEKQSLSFIGLMESFLAILEDELVDLQKISFKKFVKTEEEMIQLFYFRFQNVPLLNRMDSVREYFADEYETLHNRALSDEEQEYIQAKFNQMYVTKDIYKIYNWMLEENGYETLPDVEYEKRKIPYEDVYPLLYLKYRLTGQKKRKEIKHLVIDEMQDYSYLQYVIIDNMFSCHMTILGDKAQTLDDEQQDVLKFLPGIFGKNIRKIIINKSYRNTVEIAEYAAKLAGISDIEILQRHGSQVREKSFENFDSMLDEIAKEILKSANYETVAILTLTEEDAYDIYRLLKKRIKGTGLPIHYIDRNSSSFQRGITVTTYYFAKGLEFDVVFEAFRNNGNPFAKQAEYIGATRALHELSVYTF